jgi:serine/threonine protein kinase
VLLDPNGRARLADFGIAKHLDEIEHSITSDGMVIGTPSYLAPEQAAGRMPSPATDAPPDAVRTVTVAARRRARTRTADRRPR